MTVFPEVHKPDLSEQPRSRYLIDCAGAQLHVHARSLATVLRVDGEIDVSNADLVGQAVRRFSKLKAPLILDLSHLDFLGLAGFRMLLGIADEHQQAQLQCSVVGGAALRPITRILTDHGLPIVDSVPEALEIIDGFVRARRQFVVGRAHQQEPQREI
jgi:anti-anti-sigma factor